MSLRLGQGPTGLTVRLDRGNASTLTAVKDGGQTWAADVSLQFGNAGETVSFPATVDGANAVWDLTAADVMTILQERPEWPLKEAGPFACRIIEAGNTVAAGQCTIGDGWTADHSSPHVIWSGATPRPGPPGPAPDVTWDGTRIVVEGVTGPDLKGPKGDPGSDADATAATAAAQQAATDSAQSAADAAASAALVGAPAGDAIDAHLGGDSTNLVDTVASKAHKDLLNAPRLRAWGHSIMWGGSTQNADACTVGVNDMATLLAAALDLPLDKRAISGASLFASNSAADWTDVMNVEVRPTEFSPIGGVYALMYGINDAATLGHTPTEMIPFKEALRSCVARIRSAAAFEDDHPSLTYGGAGTWVEGTGANSGKGQHFNKTSGGTFTITVPTSFPGGTISIGLITYPDGGGGTITGPASLGSPTYTTTTYSGTDSWHTGVMRIENVPAGGTVYGSNITPTSYTFTTSACTGARGVIVDWWGWEPDDKSSAIVALVGQPKPIDYSSESNPVTDAGIDVINTIQQDVATEFGDRVLYVDNSYYDHNTNAPAGHPFWVMANVHPSADVHAGMAANTAQAIKSVGATFVRANANTAEVITPPSGWVGYNPALAGSGSSLGNGTSTAYWRKDADGTVDVYGSINLGTTSVVGTSIDIPVPLPERSGSTLISKEIYVVVSGIGNFTLNASLGNASGYVRLWLPPVAPAPFIASLTSGSTTITGPAGTFSSLDVGAPIQCAGIPDGAKIATVTNDTTAVLSDAATATTGGQTAQRFYKWAQPTATRPIQWRSGCSIKFGFRYRCA